MPAEIRWFPRFTVPGRNHVDFITPSGQITGELHEVSLRGLFLLTKKAVPLGSVGKVGVEFRNWFFRTTAVVRSVEPGRGLGPEFIQMCSLDRQALHLFCGAQRRAAVENKSTS